MAADNPLEGSADKKNENNKNPNAITVEEKRNIDPIINAVGELGRWQLMICLLLFLVRFPVGSHQFAISFLGPPIEFKCADLNITDKCSPDCHKIIYDRSIFEETIRTEFELICEYKFGDKFSQSVFVFGSIMGNGIFGIYSDNFGRKPALQFAVLMLLIFGIGASISPWFWLFCVMRFLVGFGLAGTVQVSLVIIVELVGPKKRVMMTILQYVPFYLGYLNLAVVSYFFRNWRRYQFIISIPAIIVLSYYCFLPESPRWLLSTSQYDKAANILEKGAEFNKMPTKHIRDDIIQSRRRRSLNTKHELLNPTIFDLFRYRNLRIKIIYMCFSSFSSGLSYFGVTQYISGVSVNIFLNVAIAATTGMFGTIIGMIMAKYWGRKKSLITSYSLAGITFLFIGFVPTTQYILANLSIFGFFWLAIIIPINSLYWAELLPTVLRNTGLGLTGLVHRVGGMVTPAITYSTDIMVWVPPIFFGTFLIISSIFGFLLPDTVSEVLPETIEDTEEAPIRFPC